MQIKTMMRYHLTPVRMVIMKKTRDNTNAGVDLEQRPSLCTVGGIVDWYSHDGKEYGRCSKIQVPYDPAIPL